MNCIVTTAYTDDAGPRDAKALGVVGQGCAAMWKGVEPSYVPIFREMIDKHVGGPDTDGAFAYFLAEELEAASPAARVGMLREAEEALARASKTRPYSSSTSAARARVAIAKGAPPATWIPEVESALQNNSQARSAYWNNKLNQTAAQAMWATGRLKDAIAYNRAALDADPLHFYSGVQYLTLLAATGYTSALDLESWDVQLVRRMEQRPRAYLWENGIAAMVLSGRGDAEAMFRLAPRDVEPYVLTCYRDIRSALRLSVGAARLAAAKKAEACLLRWDSAHVVVEAASILGDLDTAFAQLDTPAKVDHNAWRYYPSWFMPRARALRADPRFLPLMEKLGYVAYWKQTKTQPDVCAVDERDIPLCVALR